MSVDSLDQNWIVQDLLEQYPAVLPVFMNWKLDCLGCSMASFCTLEDVSNDYHLDVEQLLGDLRQAITQSAL